MKTTLLYFCMLISTTLFGQENLFFTYSDSVALVRHANEVTKDFSKRVNDLSPGLMVIPVAKLNTKPYLIFYSPKSNQISLPLWTQVIEPQKIFFEELGGKGKGELLFGLFFNGFYISHELGHALQNALNKKSTDRYQSEYFANQIAILYWYKTGRESELQKCYEYAKMITETLANPVPVGSDSVQYFNENYDQIGSDPYKYGYFQFRQFVAIYEDKTMGNFDEFIKRYINQ